MTQGRTLLYKEVLNQLETESPGTKQYFYCSGFLDEQRRKQDAPLTVGEKDQALLHPCATCGHRPPPRCARTAN